MLAHRPVDHNPGGADARRFAIAGAAVHFGRPDQGQEDGAGFGNRAAGRGAVQAQRQAAQRPAGLARKKNITQTLVLTLYFPADCFQSIIHAILVRIYEALQAAMPMREKPPTDRQRDAAKNEQFIPHNQRRQNDE